MQSQANARKNSSACADGKSQANAISSAVYVTPEKKTKPHNYSPGKKPMRNGLQDPHYGGIAVSPFVLF